MLYGPRHQSEKTTIHYEQVVIGLDDGTMVPTYTPSYPPRGNNLMTYNTTMKEIRRIWPE